MSVAGKEMQTSASAEDRSGGIRVVGAGEHNLKNVSLSLSKDRITAFVGVSSGDVTRRSVASFPGAVAIVLAFLASCSAGPTEQAADDLAERCGTGDPGVPVRALSYDPDPGEGVDGFVLGEGSKGVVFSNQIDTDLCDWLPYARETAGEGRRVLIYDYSYKPDASEEVEAAAEELGSLGVDEAVLVGASKGAIASLAAAPSIREPEVTGLASLSAIGEFEGLDSREAARKLRISLLLMAARDDGDTAEVARDVAEISPSEDERVEVVGGYDHGLDLLGGENGPRTRRLLEDFVGQSLE